MPMRSAPPFSVHRLILIPPRPGLRVFAVPEPAAVDAMRWLRRMVVVTVGGYAIAEVGLLFGLSDEAYLALLSLVILFDHACLAVIVLQQRGTVRTGSRTGGCHRHVGKPAEWPGGDLALDRADRIGRAVAGARIAGSRRLYAHPVSVLRYRRGAAGDLRDARAQLRSLDRVLRLEPTVTSRYPGLETRLNWYRPVLDATAEAVVYIVAVLALLELWGLGAFGWLFASTPGRHLIRPSSRSW